MFKKYGTSAPGQDGVAAIRFILLPETAGKPGQVSKGMDFRQRGGDCGEGNRLVSRDRKGELDSTWEMTNRFTKRDY